MSASGVFGQGPEGIDLTETQNTPITIAVVTLMVIGTIFVVLRFVARTRQKGVALAIDDYSTVLGLIFAHGTAICSLASLWYGGGKHLWVLSAKEFTSIWKILFAYVIIYAFAVTFTKISIVLFYRRIFGMSWALWFCVFQVVSYLVVVVVTILTACQPLPYFWNRYTNITAKGHCIDVPNFFFANGIWAMLIDVCILIAPITTIYKLHMPPSQKAVVTFILLLGSFVCIASIVRITTIHIVITSTDLTWAMGKLFIWSCCEPFIGIVCACLPTFAPFFRRWWVTLGTREREGPADSSSAMPKGKPPTFSNYRSRCNHRSTSTDILATSSDERDMGFPVGKSMTPSHKLADSTPQRNHGEVELYSRAKGPSMHKVSTQNPHRNDIHVQQDTSCYSVPVQDNSFYSIPVTY